MAIDIKLIKQLREMTGAGIVDTKNALEATNGDIDAAILWLRENGLAKAAKKSDRIAAEGVTEAREDADSALILEVNSETDFVAKNSDFMKLIDNLANAILKSNAKNLEETKEIKISTGETIQEALTNATAKIGEKIDLRRLDVHQKTAEETIAIYNHANHRVSVMLIFEGQISKEDAYSVAMHVAAMNPKYLDAQQIPQEFKDQEYKIIVETTNLDGKPEAIKERILTGRLQKRLAEVNLLDQDFVVDEKFKVGQFIKSKNAVLKEMVRYEVGEGIEKITTDFASEVAAQVKGN